MGTTTNGLWFPDENTPLGSLHTLLATMAQSADDRIEAVRTALLAAFPTIRVQAGASSLQPISANTPTLLNGNSGWITTDNTAAGFGSPVAGGTVSTTPITVTAAGRYDISFEITHSAQSTGRAFIDLVLLGTTATTRRIIWTGDDTASGSFPIRIAAGTTTIGLRTYYLSAAAPPSVNSANLMVEKTR